MNNPTPPRAPELQAALALSAKPYPDWENADAHLKALDMDWPTSDNQALEYSDKCAGILATEVYRLEEQVSTLRTALASAELWHSGDKWRFSKDPKERECWERRKTEIKAALAQPSETKETKS